MGSIVNAIGLVFAAMLGYWINSRASSLLDLDVYLQRLPAWVKRFPIGSPRSLSVRLFRGSAGPSRPRPPRRLRCRSGCTCGRCAIAIPICTLLAISATA